MCVSSTEETSRAITILLACSHGVEVSTCSVVTSVDDLGKDEEDLQEQGRANVVAHCRWLGDKKVSGAAREQHMHYIGRMPALFTRAGCAKHKVGFKRQA